jgi:hypothetical protein
MILALARILNYDHKLQYKLSIIYDHNFMIVNFYSTGHRIIRISRMIRRHYSNNVHKSFVGSFVNTIPVLKNDHKVGGNID